MSSAIEGKDDVVDLALTALLARGHLLLEDVPGVGKTTLARALSQAVGGEMRRVQFTSDMLPGDVLGVSIFDRETGDFKLRRGPVFSNILLADEINRASPRTQSALLEAMNEGQVSIDGVTLELPQPFFVVATQNPQDFAGTFPLPESQLDRFMMRIEIGYPPPDVETRLMLEQRVDRADGVRRVLEPGGLLELQQMVNSAEQLRRTVEKEDQAAVAEILKQLKGLTSEQVFKDPAQFERLQAAAADAVKRFEFNLRRRTELKGNEVLLSGDGDVPEEFRKLVEQYYKSLSKGGEKK